MDSKFLCALAVAVVVAVVICLPGGSAQDLDDARCAVTGAVGCESCTENKGCYYCEKSNFCFAFHGDGTESFFPDTDKCDLNEVKWLQCTLDYQAMLIIAAVAVVLLLASFVCCCYCCCCRG